MITQSTQNYFVRDDDKFFLSHDTPKDKYEVLPSGNYLVEFSPMVGFYLTKFDNFTLPKKVYGNHSKDADRILSTYAARPSNTGVLLAGEKGSGKTLLTKQISVDAYKHGIPTLIVNNPYGGDDFSSFLSQITQPCILLFDEFEKVYELKDQRNILTLMDGVFKNNKLFLLTCNDKSKIDSHMCNRPGRLFYMMEYKGLDGAFIAEYCEDNLINKALTDSVCALGDLFFAFNFDMLQAVVEEMNRYGETAQEALRMLNVKPDFRNTARYVVALYDKDGNKVPDYHLNDGMTGPKKIACNPLSGVEFWIDTQYGPDGKFTEDEKFNEEAEGNHLSFKSEDITKIDGRKGLYHFKNQKGEVVHLTKEIPETFNYAKYL